MQARQDLGGQGLAFAYDPAERLIQAAKSPAPLTLVPNNTAVAPPALAGLPDAFGYTYDVAQNLLARTATNAGVLATTALPLDDSGRNRPGSVSGVALVWDRNGNLIQKGNVHYSYDFRNRLTDVADGSNNPIAHYDYDAWNRRIAKTVAGDVKTTTWQGWHPIEDYDGSRLLQRRTYGDSLDDIVYLESDLDGTGTVATKSWPLYDSTGNLVLLTGPTGLPIERYDYTPYGAQTILVNSTPPAVEQVRVVGNAVWVELSEAVNPGPLAQAATVGTLKLFDNTLPAAFGALTVTQPVTTGDLAQRRLVLVGQPPGGFQPGDQVTLTVPAGALLDSFLNQPAHDYTLAFTWPASDAVVADLAAPTVQRVTLQQGMLSVEVSAEPSLTAATAAIQLDGAGLTWSLAADHYTLQAATPVAAGTHTLTIATTLTDAGNQPLAAPFSQTFTTVTAQDSLIVYTAPNPQLATGSALGNLFGYQGRNLDPETGLLYFRNRYYDPQLGRFITADPKGYADGPSMYAFEVDDPTNGRDPMGLRDLDEGDKNFIRGISKSQKSLIAEYQAGKVSKDAFEAQMEDLRTQRLTYIQAVWDAAPGQPIRSDRQVASWTDGRLVTRYKPQPTPEEIKRNNARGEQILGWTVAVPTVATGLLAAALPPTPGFAGESPGRATTELSVEPDGTPSKQSPQTLSYHGFRPPPGTRVRPEGIFSEWRVKPSTGEGGTLYYNPQNRGDSVRVMPGQPMSKYGNSQTPYVRWQSNGQALDVNANPVSKYSQDAHIPLQLFVFDPGVFK